MAANAELKEILEALEASETRRKYNAASFFVPYERQLEFFTLGVTKRERLLMAGNQLGKTEAGAIETASHLTGEYPDWWPGRVFTHPVKGWAAGETSLIVRDVQQKKLCGEAGVDAAFGTGMIPKARFTDKPSLARGVTDAFDTIQVEHSNWEVKKGSYIRTRCVDGISVLRFKSYEQGRQKFQGETLDFFWPDEEPDADIYSEGLTRTVATGGMSYLTFTPLKGMSDVVRRFREESSPDRGVVTMTIDDVGHITPEQKKIIVAGYLPHEREARARGVPMLGSGRIFTASEESISEATIEHIPIYWRKLWGIDFGIGHPFAAALGLWDVDNDIIHITNVIRIADQMPPQHAKLMKAIGAGVPVAWPQDGTAREKGSGEPLSKLYQAEGLSMLPDPAMWPDGGNSTEAGILDMQERFASGRLKIAAHLSDFFAEYREYHRKDGQIVKVHDDIMSAVRQIIMAKRFARAVPLGKTKARRGEATQCRDVDFDLS